MSALPPFAPLPATLLEPLPPSVQRYLRMALPHGIPQCNKLTLTQRGEMRLKEGRARWYPFSATEQFGLHPPELLWRARMRLAPLLVARVQDSYLDGLGSIEARLWGVLPLAHADHDARLDAGALLRYLAEAAWFPAALLPSARLQWQSAGRDSAVALLRDSGNEARLTFHFNASGEIERVAGLRPRLLGNDYVTQGWSGRYTEWQALGGMRIPTRAHVCWHLDAGEWEYWRGTIVSLDYPSPSP